MYVSNIRDSAFMVKTYKRSKKSSKRHGKQSRNTRTRFQRTRSKSSKKRMMGGAVFNQPTCFSDIPQSDYYKMNTYNDDTSRAPYLQDSRLMSGGGSKCSKIYGGRSKKTFRRKNRRLQKGGISLTNDPFLGSAPVGPVGNFGSSSGTGLNFSLLSSGTASIPGAIVPYDTNTPPTNMPAMV